MELDEFKGRWKNIQEKEIEKQKLNTETLNNIIMKTTTTLAEIQKRNAYWQKLATAVCSALIAVLLVNLVMLYFIPDHHQTVDRSPLPAFSKAILPVIIMIVFAIVTIWFHKRLERIFEINNDVSLKASLETTIVNFRKFYIQYNLVYLVLFPAYYYAFIALFLNFLALSASTILLICGGLTIISFIINHVYYKIKYFKRIKVLEDNLNELT